MSNRVKIQNVNTFNFELPAIAMEPGTDMIFVKSVPFVQKAKDEKSGLSTPTQHKGKTQREDDYIEHKRYFVIKAGSLAKERFPGIGPLAELGVSVDASAGQMTLAEMNDWPTGKKFECIHYMQVNGYVPTNLTDEQIKDYEEEVAALRKKTSKIKTQKEENTTK